MAVVQISRIQHRKGLQQDLPQLASAEMGWAIDARRLYIGNGTIAEGAPIQGVTEILTQYSDILNISENYTFKGTQSGYTSQTGPTALTPIQRTLQQALDDTVNVRNFGARGDGNTDDTAALQRAIDEVYFGNFSLTTPRLRRAIRLPAGVYLINSSLKLPSYTQLIGDGRDRTVIRQASNLFPMAVLKDSAGKSGADYGTGAVVLVKNLMMSDMTLENTQNQNLLELDSGNQMEFVRVTFRGATTASTSTVTTNQNAVLARPRSAGIGDITNVSFIECEFFDCDQGVIANVDNMRFVACKFDGLSRGIVVDQTATAATTKNIKALGCTFDNVGRNAVLITADDSDTDVSFMSNMNYYGEVGTGYAGAGSPIVPVLSFAGANNYSVGDNFVRSDADHFVQPRVSFATSAAQVGLDAKTGLTLGVSEIGSARVITLGASQTNANTGIVLAGTTGVARIHYWLQRPDVSAYRTGTIDVVYDGTNIQYSDEYTEFPNATILTYPGPTGITFAVTSISASKAALYYTSDVSGSANLTYQITSLRQ